jgi:hypothetical protein
MILAAAAAAVMADAAAAAAVRGRAYEASERAREKGISVPVHLFFIGDLYIDEPWL